MIGKFCVKPCNKDRLFRRLLPRFLMQSFAVQFFLSLILGLNSLTLHAQGITQPSSIPSPNAIGMGMGVTNPVNLYTGTVAVNLPIKNLNERGIALPIILSYDGSGVRPEQHPTWVGQNWNLSAGGSIVRVVNNMPDEANIYHFRFDKNFDSEGASYYSTLKDSVRANYFYNCKDLMLKNISQSALKILADSSSSHYFSYTVFDAYNNSGGKTVWVTGIDYQPDIFMFNFMGFTGQFFLGNDGKWKVSSQQNIKIVFDYNNSSNYDYPFVRYASDGVSHYDKTIFGFKLIDDKGTTYVFGYDANAVEYDMPFFGQNKPASKRNQWVANAWHLTKVVDKFGVEVYNLKYSRGYFVGNFYNADGTAMDGKGDDSDIYSFDGYTVDKNIYLGDLVCSDYKFHDGKVNGRLISPCYLSTIYSQGRVVAEFNRSVANDIRYTSDDFIVDKSSSRFYYLFNSNSAFKYPNADISKPLSALKWSKLNSIKFEDNTTANFVYNDSTGIKISERLNLIRLEIKGDPAFANCKTNKYKFYYNKFEQLPGFLSKKVDHWGFFNGRSYQIRRSVLDEFYKEREPNTAFSLIGSLKKIESPTGSLTEYIFEPHEYYSEEKKQNYFAGGLRIKNVIHYDGFKTYAKEFQYVNKRNKTSSGNLLFMPKYYFEDNYIIDKPRGSDQVKVAQKIFSVNTIVPLVNTNESHIGYSNVQEILKDGSYCDYKFSSSEILDEPPFVLETSMFNPYTSSSLKRGVLLEKVDYDSTGVWVGKTKYKYDTFGKEKEQFVYSSYAEKVVGCDMNLVDGGYKGGIRKLYYYDYLPVEITTIQNLNGRELLSSRVGNTYSFLNIDNADGTVQLRETESKTEKGGIIKRFLYPSDYLLYTNISEYEKKPIGELVTEYRLGEPIETFSFLNGIPNGHSMVEYIKNGNTVVPYKLYSSPNDNKNQRLMSTIDKVDTFGNVLQVSKRGGGIESIVYGYNNRFPIIKLLDVKYDDFVNYLSSKSLTIAALQSQDSTTLENYYRTIRTDFYKRFPKGYFFNNIYKPTVGAVKETDAKGNSIITEYDCFGIPYLKRDSNKNILNYNETNTTSTVKTKPIYRNFAISKVFYSHNCSSLSGAGITYRIPSGKHASEISQTAADSLALIDLNYNGQKNANSYGSCAKPYVLLSYKNLNGNYGDVVATFFSDPELRFPAYANNLDIEYTKATYLGNGNVRTERCVSTCSGTSVVIQSNAFLTDDRYKLEGSMSFVLIPSEVCDCYYVAASEIYGNDYLFEWFTKNDCENGFAGSRVIYEIPEKTYYSSIGRPDANNKAKDDIARNGQNYANLVGGCRRFGNKQVSQFFYKNNCSTNQVGSKVEYTVNASRHFSSISQEDADAKAQADINKNGQNYANTYGKCADLFYNKAISSTFIRNDCPSNSVGSQVTYIVPAGKYTSAISQDDANEQAAEDVNLNGQAYANRTGTCTMKEKDPIAGEPNILYSKESLGNGNIAELGVINIYLKGNWKVYVEGNFSVVSLTGGRITSGYGSTVVRVMQNGPVLSDFDFAGKINFVGSGEGFTCIIQ